MIIQHSIRVCVPNGIQPVNTIVDLKNIYADCNSTQSIMIQGHVSSIKSKVLICALFICSFKERISYYSPIKYANNWTKVIIITINCCFSIVEQSKRHPNGITFSNGLYTLQHFSIAKILLKVIFSFVLFLNPLVAEFLN